MEFNMEWINYFQYNAIVTLTMFFVSLAILIINSITKGYITKKFFSTERASLLNPITYIRFFTHILGHKDWKHFSGNYMKILLLGPLMEEKYGAVLFLAMILTTALITAIVNFIDGKYRIYGASSVVYMLIVLSAFVNLTANKIPITLVLIILFYLVDEIKKLPKMDGIGHGAHLVGAICGAAFGFVYTIFQM